MSAARPLELRSSNLAILSLRVLELLGRHLGDPWPVLATESRRQGLDPRTLTPMGLGFLVQPLSLAVGRFAGPASGLKARRELVELLRNA